mgnify:CR=1 FL=1
MAEKTSIEATPAGVTVEEPGKPSAQQQQEEKTNSSGKVSQNPKPEEADEGENEDKNLTEEEEESSVEDKDDDDSAAGVVIPRRRDLRKSTRVQHDMNLVRNAMRDSYQNEGKKVLLHGYLHIHVGRAKGLRNLDCMRGCHTFLPSTIFLCLATNVSDPYVTVHAGRNRLIKTKTIFDDLNPEWNMDYYVPISHPIEHLEFRVKDWDQVSNEMIGRAFLPVSDLIQFGTDGRQLRRGVHRVVYLDGSVRNGAFEFYVEFIPKDMMHSNLVRTKGPGSNMVVPGVYFKARQQNQIKLYINADDKSEELGTPTVKYGEGLKKTWKPQRLWKDIYQTFCEAKHLIYAVGWSIDYRQSLLRGDECKNALIKRSDGKGYYSSNIGELLKQKANEGVVVNLMVWDDNTSTALMDGVIGTRDEQLRNYFSHTKVNVHLVAIAAGNAHVMKKLRQSVYYTHHQKCVIADTPSKQLVAYVGTYFYFHYSTETVANTVDRQCSNISFL